MLDIIYKEYKSAINNGISKSDAKYFGSAKDISKKLMPSLSFDDLNENLRELHRAGYLINEYADDSVYSATLTDEAITFKETEVRRKIAKYFDLLSKFSKFSKFF